MMMIKKKLETMRVELVKKIVFEFVACYEEKIFNITTRRNAR